MTTYADESNRSQRVLYHYDPRSPIVYDEGRNIRLRSFRCSFLLLDMQPACTDCGAVITHGYASDDGADSVVYCDDCIEQIVESTICQHEDCYKIATFYRRGVGLYLCEYHRAPDDIVYLQ